MATLHIAALFIPHTASFDTAAKEESPPPSPGVLKRNSSLVTLLSRMSVVSLFGGPASSTTPRADTEAALNANPFDFDSRRISRPLTQSGDPSNLLLPDADVPEWGSSTQLYNQPRSRAGPLPSRSILDFGKLQDHAMDQLDLNAKRRVKTPPNAVSSFGSSECEYEQWTIEPAVRGNAGLVNAIRAAINEGDLHVSWVGTLGFPTDALDANTKLQIQDKLVNDYDSEVIYVSDKDFDGHYANYCKVMLWPIFHYQVADHPKSKAYMDHSWKFYFNVNRAFADQLIKSYQRDDTIWVHDYHLLLVPGMIREKLPDAKIGFFLHTAFPSSEIFRCQMKYRDLLKGMLGANLVAFQLQEYADHFLQSCSRFLRVETFADGVQLEDRYVNVTHQPIGINPSAIQAVRKTEAFAECVKDMQEKYQGKHLIVARDKLDYVHGVRQKLLTYERFLDQNPQKAQDTVLLQLITSPHEQTELLTGISDICSRIDRKHATLTQQPLVVLKQDLSLPQYYALLTVADVLMNSTLRDGMNLIAHEFVFCQDVKQSSKRLGALILSEFAGSATIFKGNYLRINPYDLRQQASAILSALSMDADERERCWKPLYDTVVKRTGGSWFKELSRTLVEVHKVQNNRSAASVPRLSTSGISKAYDQASRRVFFLDYEGTLISNQTSAGALLTSPQRIIDIVNDLMMDPKNAVYVMSGSTHQQLTQIFQTAEGVGLVAENGCYMLAHGEAHPRVWKTAINEQAVAEWKSEVRKVLRYYQDRLEGSLIEELDASLVFRFNDVEDQDMAKRLAGDCAVQFNSSCNTSRVRAVPTADTLLIEQMDCDKSTMAAHVFDFLQQQSDSDESAPPDFVMVAGDDREDEVVFRWANQLSMSGRVKEVFTVSIGKRDTEAQAALLQGCAGLLAVLEKLAESSLQKKPITNPGRKRSTRFDFPTK